MNNSEYFAQRDRNLPAPKFEHGSRVFARFEGVPAAGTVLREQVNQVLIYLDLPVKTKYATHTVVWVPVDDVRKMKELAL